MRTKRTIPPQLARNVLLSFLREDIAEEVLGDLEEKFYLTLKDVSPTRAKLGYYCQVFHYLRPFAIRKSKLFYSNQYAMYRSYLKISWRNLLRNKGYSSINIGGLAMGMTVALLVGLWIYDELSFNKYHQNYDTIAKVYRTNDWGKGIETSTPLVAGLGGLLRSEYSLYFKNVVMIRQRLEDRVLASGENKFTEAGYFMQPEGVEMFSLNMLRGSGKHALNEMTSIILSKSLAKKLFGDEDPLNKTIRMNAETDFKVTGVYEDLPKNSELYGAAFFAPLEFFAGGKDKLNIWDNYNMTMYVQLHHASDITKASEIIKDAMVPHVDEETRETKPQLFLHPMRDWRLNAQFENGVAVISKQMKTVRSYTTIGVFVLLLACINFMNLSTARSEKRAREVGIRKSIGSQRNQLVQQFFGESLLVASLSCIVSLVVAKLVLPGFNALADKEMIMPWNSVYFWLSAISFTLVTGLLAGSYPALYLSSFNPVKVLKGTFKTGRSGSVPRSILVTVQFVVSISLIIGTMIVYQQIEFAKNRPIGYNRSGLLSLKPRSPEFYGKYESLRNELIKTGVVEDIAEANYPITSTLGWNGGFSWNGKKVGDSFNTIFVTHEYGKTIGWEFVQGRDFSREITSDTAGIVINESALKLLGLENPIGETLNWHPGEIDRGNYKILGVVKDMVKGSPFDLTEPSIIFLSRFDLSNLYIRINPDVSVHAALPKIRDVFSKLIPSAPFDYTFADEDYAAKFGAEERVGRLAAMFTVLAIFISCLGLFGLASYVAEQRTKEIGIRKVLGASVANLWKMLSQDFVVLVFIACAIAIPIAFYLMTNWLESYEYRVSISWWVFLWAGGGALLITILTVSFQAVKAAMTNPVKSLRSE